MGYLSDIGEKLGQKILWYKNYDEEKYKKE